VKFNSKSKSGNVLYGLLACAVVFLVIVLFFVRFKVIDGHERGVLVGMNGVSSTPLQPGIQWYVPITTALRIADVGQQRFVMNNDGSESAGAHKGLQGRAKDELILKSKDNQNVHVSCALLWHRDPTKVCEQQKVIGNVDDDSSFSELVIRQPLLTIIKNNVTIIDALEAYSGEKHVALQKSIEAALKSSECEYTSKGVIVDSFVLDIGFDNEFIKPIVERQIAIQQQTTYKQQQTAAEAKALVAKAEAQAAMNQQVVAAEGVKQVAILQAEQENQKVILQAKAAAQQVTLAAEAAKQQVVLAAEGEKQAAQNKADAVLAEGTAKAAAQKLQYSAYAAPGAEVYARIQIAESLAKAYSGVRGFIPEKMTLSTFSDSFQKGVGVMVNPQPGQ